MEAPALDGGGSARRSALALPGIFGGYGPLATQSWQCQGLLARMPQMPPKAGTARDFWYAVGRVDHAVEKPPPSPALRADSCNRRRCGVYSAADISPGPLASAGTRKDKVDEELAMQHTPARPSRPAGGHARVQHRVHISHPTLASRMPSNAKLSPHGLPLNERRHLCNLPSLTSTLPTRLLPNPS